MLLAAFYPAIDILNNFGAVSVHDVTVRRWEHALVRRRYQSYLVASQPERVLVDGAARGLLRLLPDRERAGLFFLATGRVDAARRAVLWLISTYLICYILFVLFPVAGPYYEFPRPADWFLDNWAARLVYATLDQGSAYGAAFPSSHVAATLMAVAGAFAGSRALGWILTGPAVLLTVGVVYCQMHYAVDALAGVALSAGLVVFWVRREKSRASGAPKSP